MFFSFLRCVGYVFLFPFLPWNPKWQIWTSRRQPIKVLTRLAKRHHVPSNHTLVTSGVRFRGMAVTIGNEDGMGAVLIAGGMRQLSHQLLFVWPGFVETK